MKSLLPANVVNEKVGIKAHWNQKGMILDKVKAYHINQFLISFLHKIFGIFMKHNDFEMLVLQSWLPTIKLNAL